jgi:hypothetical protein
MPWLRAHPLAVVLVAAALAGTTAAFAFARPEYHPRATSVTIDMAAQPHYAGVDVTRVFAAHGLQLALRNRDSGMRFYAPPGTGPSDFLVTIYPLRAKVSFGLAGPKPLVDRRVGNVEVSYGGHDVALAARIAAAADALGD